MSALVESRGTPYAVRTPRFTALAVITDGRLREVVVRGLHTLGALEVVEAASVAEARARTRAVPPLDLLVVEVALPDGSGVALLTELRALGWHRGIALAADGDPFSVRAALSAGVRGFLVTESDNSPGRVAAGLPRGIEDLSAREVEVLQLVAGGHSNRDIGVALHLSALTVKSHLARISRKLGTGDRAEMVALALRAGVIR